MPLTRRQRRERKLQVDDNPLMFNGFHGSTRGLIDASTAKEISDSIERRMMSDIRRVSPYVAFRLPEVTDEKSYHVMETYANFLLRFSRTQIFINSKQHLFRRGVQIDDGLLAEHKSIRRCFKAMLKSCDWFDLNHRNHMAEDRKRYEMGVYMADGSRFKYGQFVTPAEFCIHCNTVDLTTESSDAKEQSQEQDSSSIEVGNQMGDPTCFAMYFDLPFSL